MRFPVVVSPRGLATRLGPAARPVAPSGVVKNAPTPKRIANSQPIPPKHREGRSARERDLIHAFVANSYHDADGQPPSGAALTDWGDEIHNRFCERMARFDPTSP